MNEREEIKIKNDIVVFLKENIVFSGTPQAIETKLYDLAGKLFNMFLIFSGQPVKNDGEDDFQFGIPVEV